MKWLRRRIVASVATQTAATFAAAAVLTFAVMYWRTDEGLLTVLFGAIVIAQLVAVARIGHAMRNNPLNYVFMRNYLDRPFSYRVSRNHGDLTTHPVAARLPGFTSVATIRDDGAVPSPCFDVYHDPSRLIAASVSRASGAVSLMSPLSDGRILVTDTRAMPPHERLVMALAADDTVESVVSTHRQAISARTDVVELISSAHQLVLDSLAIEYEAYVGLGPALSPFLDLEPSERRFGLRLIARIRPRELVELPARIGPDVTSTPRPPVEPTIFMPYVAPSPVVVPNVVAPEVVAPQIAAPDVVAPDIVAVEVVVADSVAPTTVPVTIGPSAFVTRFDDDTDVTRIGEPITADVPIVGLVSTPTCAPAPVDASAGLVAGPREPATLAEAMPTAPPTAESLDDSAISFWEPTSMARHPVRPGGIGSDLSAALGYEDEPSASRPRLSAVLRANAGAVGENAAERSHRNQP